jgi:hypothetical protein
MRGRTLTLAPAAEAVGLELVAALAVGLEAATGRLVAAGPAGRVLVGLLVPAGRESALREVAVAVAVVVGLAALSAAFKVAVLVPPGGAGGGGPRRLVATPVFLVKDATCLGGVKDEPVCEKKSSDMAVVAVVVVVVVVVVE